MNPAFQIVIVLLSAISTLFTGLMFFVMRDLRDRIMRLENQAMHGAGSVNVYRRASIVGTAGQE